VTSAAPAGDAATAPVPAGLVAEAEAWLSADPDPATRAELKALLEAGDLDALRARFDHPLRFGTAGLRGALGAGPGMMNRLVVRRTTAGLAWWVLDQGNEAARRGIVVGRDARHRSDDFAADVADVAAGLGVSVRVLPRPLPTPLTAFAVKHFEAAAGVMITASHNPAADNGYKVYMADGAQVIPPHDVLIAEAASKAATTPDQKASVTGRGSIEEVDEAELLEAYRRAVSGFLDPDGPRNVRIVYTPLHGVGGRVMTWLLERAGFGHVHVVAEQAAPDPDFPTVAFPNPEEPGALDLALADAAWLQADVILANDPDADRLAVAVPDPVSGRWRVLTGDELGVLLADHVLAATTGDDRLVATTVVSSTMLSAMAEAAGIAFVETLTGFKWIARAASRRPGHRLVLGYEEALGYQVGETVSDKDGMSAALVAAEICAGAKAGGTSVLFRLDELASRFGLHATAQWPLRLSGPTAQAEMAELVASWRKSPPGELAGLAVNEVVDLSKTGGELPATDALVLRLAHRARVVLRPSGTEPKLKAYFEVVTEPLPLERVGEARREADRLLRALADDVAQRCADYRRTPPTAP